MTKKKTENAANDLAILFPKRQTLQVQIRPRAGSDEYEIASAVIAEMDIMQIGRALVVIESLQDEFRGTPNFVRIAIKHQAEMNEFLGIAIGWQPEQVSLLAAGSFLRIVEAVFKANPYFFPLLLGLAASAVPATMPMRTNGAGGESSTTSSAAATPTPGSSPESKSISG